ncbi:hypothetical protein M413DRAFT_444547 [Hebeloma cylindrosporum]|uniref:Uncharacterized protein n=1 Tax=Hebeloma cylindrosporum TaxID=76867 RepID=A0A0C3CH31_HEBCY|nr:hypothetical protein M413DRAFT_444547 [Hebeloma cylindrosporum h7]
MVTSESAPLAHAQITWIRLSDDDPRILSPSEIMRPFMFSTSDRLRCLLAVELGTNVNSKF